MSSNIQTAIWGRNADDVGVAPSIALINPKSASNVGMAVRLASCYGIKQVWWTGNRVNLDISGKKRLPREERMKGYRDVSMIQHDMFLDQFADAVPVAVEVRDNSESLLQFEHPENALYIFGPEDGSIPKPYLVKCHRFVVIPTAHCLNLATAVATVLWDRRYKMFLNGQLNPDEQNITPGVFEERGLECLQDASNF